MSQIIIKPSLSIIVPVYNEMKNLESLITEISTVLESKIHYELIYVDDGSTDNSIEILRNLIAQFSRLKVIRHQQRYGQSAALLSGIKAASAEWIVTLDGDGQNDPADILKLWEILPTLTKEVQMIAGVRLKRQDSYFKRVSSRIANWVRSRLLRDNVQDSGCGLKLFSRQIFFTIPHFNHMHRFFPALFLRQGVQMLSVVVNHRPRTQGQSKYGFNNRFWVGIIDLLGVIWLKNRSCLPLTAEEIQNEK